MENTYSYIFIETFQMQMTQEEQKLLTLRKDPFLSSHYKIDKILGQGCFGRVLRVRSLVDDQPMALKITKTNRRKIILAMKNQIEIMSKLQGKVGIPKIYKSRIAGDSGFLEMELLGGDLNNKKEYKDTQITQLTLELLNILAGVHECNVLHQDLKPQNIMRSIDGKLYLVDFGLARNVSNNHSTININGFIGTPRYASIRAHNQFQQSKKDDLQSLFYVIAYLYNQKLPWSNLQTSSNNRLQKIRLLKIKNKDTLFCQMPGAFQQAFRYIMGLQHQQAPNYTMIKSFFKRNQSLINTKCPGAIEQIKNTRRTSLSTNLLEVPVQMLGRGDSVDQKMSSKGSSRSIRSGGEVSGSLPSISWISDRLLCQFLDLSQGQNCRQDQIDDPPLPDLSKFSKALVFKNPFAV